MTTGFGFCARCGTPRIGADQKFCAVCGSALSPNAAQAQADTPAPVTVSIPAPAWPAPAPMPAALPEASPVVPPRPAIAYSAAPAPGYEPPTPSYPAPPPPAATGFKITPIMLLIGAVVVVALVAGYLYLNKGSGSSGITFSPSTVSCSNPLPFTTTAHLPATVKGTDTITITFDGKAAGPTQVDASGSDVTQQPDGSWIIVSTTDASQVQSLCAAGGTSGGFSILTPGTHTMQVLDATGKVLAQGSYTVAR